MPREFMLSALNWLSIEQRIKLNVMTMIFKIKKGETPDYLCNELRYMENHIVNLSNKNDFKILYYKTENARNSIFYIGLKLFNDLPDDVKNSQTLSIFKSKCIKYVKEKFPLK